MTTTTPVALPVTRPGDHDYDIARQAWNLRADQHPAAVCVATGVADVQAAFAFAREHGLRVAPQVTGHLAGSLPSLEDTLLLKLALAGTVEVDPVARVARIPAGARWDDVVGAVAPHGLAAMHGSSPSVGVMGYLLGGGLSFYGRAHGLAVNHVRAFEVVTPDGELRRAAADEHAELFWALRGGGGGYAVVTAVELGLLPYAEVTGGALFFDAAHAAAILRAWRDWTHTAPASMTTTWRVLRLPPLPHVPEPIRGRTVVCVDGVALDAPVAGSLERALRPVAAPVLGGFGPLPAAAVARLHGDPEEPSGGLGDGILLDRLDDAAIATLAAAADPASALLLAEVRHLGGALAAPPAHAGARGHLEGEFLLFALGLPGVTGSEPAVRRGVDALVAALGRVGTGTRFTSFAEGWGSLRTCVPDASLARLARVRAEHDPDGVLVAPHLP